MPFEIEKLLAPESVVEKNKSRLMPSLRDMNEALEKNAIVLPRNDTPGFDAPTPSNQLNWHSLTLKSPSPAVAMSKRMSG